MMLFFTNISLAVLLICAITIRLVNCMDCIIK